MQLSIAAANAAANAVCTLLNGGYARVYASARPASTETAVSSQVLLAECRFATPAFGGAVGGVADANPIVEEDATHAAGNAAWIRLLRADGTTVVADGSVGVGDLDLATDQGFELEIADVAILAGRRFGIVALRYSQPRS